MASVEQKDGQHGEILKTKRPHVKTEKMQEFLNMRHKDGDGSPQKLLKCPQEGCDKVLTSSPGLRYHIRTHSGLERPFQCLHCKKTFKSANGLKYHTVKTKCEERTKSEYSAAVNLQEMFDMEPIAEELVFTSSDDEGKLQEVDEQFISQDRPAALESCSSQEDLMSCEDASADEEMGDGQQPNLLTQLAIIATSPQSPLLQKTGCIRDSSSSSISGKSCSKIHTYAKPPDSSVDLEQHIPQQDSIREPVDNQRTLHDEGESGVSSSSPFPVSPQKSSDSNGNWSHSWPTAEWQCFIRGTRIRFVSGSRTEWQLAEELGYMESLKQKAASSRPETSYAPFGLKLLHIEECRPTDRNSNPIMRLRFTPDYEDQPELVAECAVDHPFFVKEKGWSSFHPSLTAEHYGIPCNDLDVGDVCLPHSHPESAYSADVFESFKSYDFTPMDSSAVFALSSMAQQKRDLELSPRSCPGSPTKKRYVKSPSTESCKAKRPMNAFMLFAKKFRMEYNQMYPGKDNRAISVMLGDKWKRMGSEQRKMYAQEAKVLAEQHKKIHPDCWKRKRNPSGGGGEPSA